MLCLMVISLTFLEIYGVSLPQEGRITGGQPASITEVPYQVSLLSDHQKIGVYTHTCGGSIIQERVILSAAQCTHETRSYQWKIRAGSSEHNDGGEVIEVTKFVQNTGFNSRLNNDIVLLFLHKNITFGETSAPATLPAEGTGVYNGFYGYISGWGILDENGTSTDTLYKTTVIVSSYTDCVEIYSPMNLITSSMVCAENPPSGFCEGDMGGPMIVDYLLAGIMSWGYGCARPGYPGVFTKVSSYRNWIDSTIESVLG